MFYIHASFTRAFHHAETIFTNDKELDDRPSDQTMQSEIKCKLPADALYVDYEISRILT